MDELQPATGRRGKVVILPDIAFRTWASIDSSYMMTCPPIHSQAESSSILPLYWRHLVCSSEISEGWDRCLCGPGRPTSIMLSEVDIPHRGQSKNISDVTRISR